MEILDEPFILLLKILVQDLFSAGAGSFWSSFVDYR